MGAGVDVHWFTDTEKNKDILQIMLDMYLRHNGKLYVAWFLIFAY